MNVKDIPSFPPGHSLPPTPEFNVPHITAASSSKADSPGRKPEPLPATQAAAAVTNVSGVGSKVRI